MVVNIKRILYIKYVIDSSKWFLFMNGSIIEKVNAKYLDDVK